MKYLIISIYFFNVSLGGETTNDVDWQTDFDHALKVAREENKNVLVYFTGSDWCAPCKVLKKDLFETDEFKVLSQRYTLLYVDIPRNQDLLTTEQMKHNKALMEKLNKKGVFPLFLALNKRGKVLDQYSGYAMNGDVRYHLEFLHRYK